MPTLKTHFYCWQYGHGWYEKEEISCPTCLDEICKWHDEQVMKGDVE